MAEERQHLLSGQNDSRLYSTPPPDYTLGPNRQNEGEYRIDPDAIDELPPPYTPSNHGGILVINCKVCQEFLSLEGKLDQHVVKCHKCNEATPIKPAPAGKKYVRCKCNCLLICKAGSRRVACPRENCKVIILLEPNPAQRPTYSPGTAHVVCAHCRQPFLFSVLVKSLARCPHCRKVSSVGPSFARIRMLAFLLSGLTILIAALLVTSLTHEYSNGNRGLYAAYVILFLCSILLLLRAFYYSLIKVSTIDGRMA